jgi:polyhydroxyalkanoate synthesis regulator phasin
MIGVATAVLVAAATGAQADRLALDALVQEGDLILEEAAALAPASKLLAEEGVEVATADKSLREEVRALNRDITQFNSAMAEHNEGVQTLRAQCAGDTVDNTSVEACSARLTQLRDQASMLDDERLQIRARQEDLNARVEKHNERGRDYAKRKQEQDHRDKLNQGDAEDWLARARQFLTSQDFAAWLSQAGNPAPCGADQMNEIAGSVVHTAVERAEACLKAVKAGSR